MEQKTNISIKERVLLIREGMEIRHWVAVGTSVVIVALLALSLTHLADGLHKMRPDRPYWEHLALAIGFDLGLLCSELAIIVATVLGLRSVKVSATFVLISTVVVSAFMNGWSLTTGKDPWSFEWCVSAVLGGFIPLLVLLLSKFATALVVGEIDERVRIFFKRFEARISEAKEVALGSFQQRSRRPRKNRRPQAEPKALPPKPEPQSSPTPKGEAEPKAKPLEKVKVAGTVSPAPAPAKAAAA